MENKQVQVTDREIKESIKNTFVKEEQAKPINKSGFTLWQVLNQKSWDSVHQVNRTFTKSL